MVANPATEADVTKRWGRELTPSEEQVVAIRLNDGWRDLQGEIPGLADRVAASPMLAETAAQVIADAVIRLMRNPDGYVRGSSTIDDFTESWDYGSGRVLGQLFFTDADLAKLSTVPASNHQAFSVIPS